MVHVLSKKRSNLLGDGAALSDEEANQIASALKSAPGGLRSALAVSITYKNITTKYQYYTALVASRAIHYLLHNVFN
jgi:hypothetical protein